MTNPEPLEPARALLERGVTDGVFAGAVALIAQNDRTLAWWAVGDAQREPTSDRRPMQPDTIFDLASLTKPVAGATAALLLLEDGVWSLDDRVASFLPWFAAHGKAEVTLRQLLTHSSGLPPWLPLYVRARDTEAALRVVRDTELAYAPGTDVRYSDVGYSLLGHLVRQVTGTPLDALLRERVWDRLGMSDTSYRPDPALRARIAATERGNRVEMRMVAELGLSFSGWRDPDLVQVGEVNDGNTFYALDGVSSHAGLFSTAPDLLAFARMYLGQTDRSVLSRATRAVAVRSHTSGLARSRGLGWDIAAPAHGDLLSPRAFGHTGFTGTSLVIDPERDLIVILLTNRTHPTLDDRLGAFRPRFHNRVASLVAVG